MLPPPRHRPGCPAIMSSYPPPHLVLDLDILALGTMNHPHTPASQPPESSSRSGQSSAPGPLGAPLPLPFTQPSALTEVLHHLTPQFSNPAQWVLNVAVSHQYSSFLLLHPLTTVVSGVTSGLVHPATVWLGWWSVTLH